MAVVARIHAESKVPEIEQKLCAGCVAYNLLLGAYALGFGAQWLTGWAAYDREAAAAAGAGRRTSTWSASCTSARRRSRCPTATARRWPTCSSTWTP